MKPKFCQSCGMPLTDDILGTNADGTKNEDYCIYCFKDGNFTSNFTMDEMVQFCAQFVDEYNKTTKQHLSREEYKEVLRQYYPNLKRWKIRNLLCILWAMLCIIFASCSQPFEPVNAATKNTIASDDASDFVVITEVVPDAILEIRYYSTFNFIGTRVDGYLEPTALLTRCAADSLRVVSDELKAQGYRLKIYDAYRPQMAVDHFLRWGSDLNDTLMRTYFYPELVKDSLFEKGYIARRSGHSRGSTVDLTLFDMSTGKELDMGGTFDWFGPESHPDFGGNPVTGEFTGKCNSPIGRTISAEQFENRMILRRAMLRHGFKPYDEEWWHFTLTNEPYPDTYFTFPVKKI